MVRLGFAGTVTFEQGVAPGEQSQLGGELGPGPSAEIQDDRQEGHHCVGKCANRRPRSDAFRHSTAPCGVSTGKRRFDQMCPARIHISKEP